jgi:hypothetical protein
MAVKNVLLLAGLTTISMVMVLACSGPKEKAMTYAQMNQGDYQNFLINWDERKNPVLYALVKDSAQYTTLFHPAALNGVVRPSSPAAEFFKNEQILIAARVMTASDDINKVFKVERVVEKNQVLALYYLFHEPKVREAFTVKNVLAVRIPRQEYKKVVFIENGKPIGELNTAGGQWSVPEMPEEPGPVETDVAK